MFELLDISEIKGSTHTIYWPDEKKLKKVGTELSINDNSKIPQIYTLPQFLNMLKKKIVKFTDSIHIIYWPAKMALKEANSWK